MNQYLAEIPFASGKGFKLEPIGIFLTKEEAQKAVEQRAVETEAEGEYGLVTELEVGREYPEGIGEAEHWHYFASEGEDEIEKGWH